MKTRCLFAAALAACGLAVSVMVPAVSAAESSPLTKAMGRKGECRGKASATAEAPTTPVTLELLAVHPDSERLIAEATRDEAGVPVLPATPEWADYMILPYDTDEENTPAYMVVMRPETAKQRGIYLANAEVAHAEVDIARRGFLDVRLTDEGAERMKRLTGDMNLGHDRLAMVLNKRIRCAPIVQLPLSREFMVSGLLDSEAEDVSKALNSPR